MAVRNDCPTLAGDLPHVAFPGKLNRRRLASADGRPTSGISLTPLLVFVAPVPIPVALFRPVIADVRVLRTRQTHHGMPHGTYEGSPAGCGFWLNASGLIPRCAEPDSSATGKLSQQEEGRSGGASPALN